MEFSDNSNISPMECIDATLINEYKIDGIECFHPAISKENRVKYIKFANDNNLLISAGSDFHGSHLPHRKNITTEATQKDITWLN